MRQIQEDYWKQTLKTFCAWYYIFLSTLKYYIIHTHTHTQQYKLLNIHLELAQVSYCENDVDCRRLIQLVHFGEKFDSSNCHKTCDNCVKVTSFVEKDVTEIAKQLVWNQILSIYCSHSSTS
jgi:hypothetical protein